MSKKTIFIYILILILFFFWIVGFICTIKNMKKIFYFLLVTFLVGCTTPKSYNFAKYAVKTGLNIAEEAGAFKQRVFVLPTKFAGDTIVYYEGINKYLLVKKDTSYIFTFTPSRQNIEDTTLQYLNRLKNEKK